MPPHGGHPALLSLDGRGQRGLTPALGYGAPQPSARGTSTPLSPLLPRAHAGLRRLRTRPPTGLRMPASPRRAGGCGPPIGCDLPWALAASHRLPLPLRRRVLQRCAPGSWRLPWPAPGLRGSAPSGALSGSPLDAAGWACCDGLRCCTPASGGDAASAPPVTRTHWAPAPWPPGRDHDRTCTGQPPMTFQGTPC
jgi:hypothetical protein